MKRYSVIVQPEASDDMFSIYRYIRTQDSPERARYVNEKIELAIFSLDRLPFRGHYVHELIELGITEFREIHFKPYRIIYQVVGGEVHVHGVLDGRRDLLKLLQERLLREG